MSRLARWALDAAARRWPAEIREEMAREWHAELTAIESQGQRLGYALSLLTSPPVRDRTGAPRGWAETTGSLTPAAVLVLAGLFTLGVSGLTTAVASVGLRFAGVEAYMMTWTPAIVSGLLLSVWCVLAGRWLGRRMPLETDRLAFYTPLLLTPALLAPVATDLFHLLSLVLALIVWVPGIGLLGKRGVLTRLIGVPMVCGVAAVAATVPMAVTSDEGWKVAVASLTGGFPPESFFVILDGLSSRAFYSFGPWAITLVAFAVLALSYQSGAMRPVPRVLRAEEAQESGSAPAAVSAAGAVCVALAISGWAYTVTVLTPAMPGVSASAPMPGGDGEIYLWVAELRWGAILLAALGLLVAAAARRRAVVGAVVLAVLLLVANAVLTQIEADVLPVALLVGGVAALLAWLTVGGPVEGARLAGTIRRRVAVGAVIAAASSPLLLSQGTPGVNHPFLPASMLPVTTGLGLLGVLLAAVAAVSLSRRRLAVWVRVLLVAVPSAIVVVAGLLPVDVSSEDVGYAQFGGFVGLPFAVVVVALLRRHRDRARGRTAVIWTLMVLAAVPGTLALWLASIYFGMVAPNLLFAIEGSGYPADGLSVVPGAALLVAPFAVLVAARLDGGAEAGQRVEPVPVLDPVG
ncbi:hypothetical protein FB565_007609 [Actinoplanes lutulentus]|nr:hypothetical protein [Actinoplanes lutulentus]MBB2947838.1 hypothetical protein [Actinoplanes lutulentus]